MPFFLGFSAIRILVGPAYPTYEYAKPNFPADPYGFTQEQRLELALVAVDYLSRPEPASETIYLLEEQQLPGSDQPLYNPAEISHMVDVKNVTDGIGRLSWLATLIVVVGLGVMMSRPDSRPTAYKAIFHGGLATTLVLLAIALFILIAWNTFFVQFHELLFPPGTWTFSYSDSLIRLFPEKFWFDFGVLLSGSALLSGLITTGIGYWLWSRFGTKGQR